ncbi:MAG: hypothetical protein ACKKL6_03975 [Candidatus Komeilibacteria bacterium]
MKVSINNLSALLVVIFIVTSFLVIIAAPLLAIETGLETTAGEAGFTTKDEAGYKNPQQIVASVVQIALGLIGTLFLVLIIVSGFQWMTAGGNSSSIDTSKKRLINATIGLIVVLAAYALTSFVITSVANI